MNNIKILFIAISLLFVLQYTHATDDGDWWLQREITLQQNREDYARRVYGRSSRSFTEKSGDPNWSLNNPSNPNSGNTKTVTKTVVVEDVPSKSKAGSAGLKRLKAFAGGGVAGVLGGVALDALVEGVGWVMEDGTYVKYKQDEEDLPTLPKIYKFDSFYGSTKEEAALKGSKAFYFICGQASTCTVDTFTKVAPTTWTFCAYKDGNQYGCGMQVEYVDNPFYDPTKEPQQKKITITDEDVGGLLLGDYDDPVDELYDVKDNIYKPPLADLYQHDSTGVGNELAKEMDQKIKNAQPTSDGNPAPIGDPRYSNPPQEDANTNDRSWEKDSSQAQGESTPTVDPETGEPTGAQSIKLQFPVFCEWAYIVCDWYDKWKETDKWLKEEPQLENKELEIQEENILDYQHETHVSFGQSCPFSPNTTLIDFGISSFSFETDLTFICTWGAHARAYVITLGHLGALIFLLLGIRNGNV